MLLTKGHFIWEVNDCNYWMNSHTVKEREKTHLFKAAAFTCFWVSNQTQNFFCQPICFVEIINFSSLNKLESWVLEIQKMHFRFCSQWAVNLICHYLCLKNCCNSSCPLWNHIQISALLSLVFRYAICLSHLCSKESTSVIS